MNLFFVTSRIETQWRFRDQLEVWVRKFAPQRFDFGYGPEDHCHQICHYRMLWRDKNEKNLDVSMSVVHVSGTKAPFHFFLDVDVDGLVFVSDAHITELNMDVQRMRMILPSRLLGQRRQFEGCLYFRDDMDAISPGDLEEVSRTLQLSVYADRPENVPMLCAHLIQRLNEKGAEVRKST